MATTGLDISELLKEGRLKEIAIGSSPSDVTIIAGALERKPILIREEISGIEVIASGCFEAHYLDNRLVNMIIKAAAISVKYSLRMGASGVSLHSRTTVDRFVVGLSRGGIEWSFIKDECGGKRLEIITEGNATVEFLGESKGLLINRIHLTEGQSFQSNLD